MSIPLRFSIQALSESDTAVRLGIDNTAPRELWVTMTELSLRLYMVEALLKFPLLLTSGYRCPALNKAIGSTGGHHPRGGAADFKCVQFGTPLVICQAIAASDIQFGQLIHEYGRWVHLSILPVEKPVNRIITIDRFGVRPGLLEVRT